ncbi:MAG: MFS transporter [Pseudomonadota bacterium]
MIRGRAGPLYYGWIVVAVAFVTMGIAVTCRTAFSLLYPEVLDEFGWDRGATAGAYSIGFVASTAMLPIIGILMDRSGPRLVIPLGAVLVAVGLVLTTTVESLVGFYLAMGVLVINGSMAMSYIVHSMFLPAWFVRNRGLAIGIAFAGVGVGGILLLPLIQWVIDADGWRTACLALAALVLVVIVPLNALFQRARPADLGLEISPAERTLDRDGAAVEVVVDADWAGTEWTPARALRTRRFWWVATAMGGSLFVWYGLQAHQTRLLLDAGFDASFAARALGFVAFCGIAGQIAIGALSDRIGREGAWTIAMGGFSIAILAFLGLEAEAAPWLVYVAIVAQGLFGSGIASVFGAVITEIFAGARLATIFALVSLCGNIGAGLGAWSLGALHDVTGSYAPGFWLCLGAALTSIVAIWLASPGQVRQTPLRARQRDRAIAS